MITANIIVNHSPETVDEEVELDYDHRQKSRFRCQSKRGSTLFFYLPRGHILRHRDCIASEDGSVVRVLAAREPVSTAYSDDTLAIARACYHLGNRHVPLQITQRWVRFQRDHVLETMVELLGLHVENELDQFDPEAGAYHAHAAAHVTSHSLEHQ